MDTTAKSQKQKMLAGELYVAVHDEELSRDSLQAQAWLLRYNAADPIELDTLLREMLGTCGSNAVIRAPFACDYGYNIHLGANVFLNCHCVLLDVNPIHIGEGTQIGPSVQIYTADHPRDPELRRHGLESGKPVTIGKNVWIGGGAILLPGITVGDDAIVGAGSVVTRNVESGQTVAGNPARVLQRR